jgi:ribosomal protein S18 acetylase RimI-like enzyme
MTSYDRLRDMTEPENYHEDLVRVVRDFFLPLGYSEEEIEDFLQSQESTEADPSDLCRLETSAGGALARIKRGSTWDISYLIPTNWDRRYEILRATLDDIIAQAQVEEAAEIFIRIEENPPSHNAYFAGLLSTHGFTLTPRAALVAPLDTTNRLEMPRLPEPIQEVHVQESDLSEMVEWYSEALLSHRKRPVSDEERRSGDEAMLKGFGRYLVGENSQAWVVLADGSRKVALAIGTASKGGDLTLSQVGVASTHRGLGLGRYVIIRCMQELLDRYGDRGKQFWVRTGRTWNPAYSLYQRLGFRTREFYTYAQWSNT